MNIEKNGADERELLPCPFCGDLHPVYAERDGVAYVNCLVCKTEGPVADVLGSAADFWNNRAVDGWARSQHDADSRELRRLCQARDEARRERDLLKVDVAALEASVGHLSRLLDERASLDSARVPSLSDAQIENAAHNILGADPANIHMRASFIYGADWARAALSQQGDANA